MRRHALHLLIAGIACTAALVGYKIWYDIVAAKSGVVANIGSKISITTETTSRLDSIRTALAAIVVDETVVQGYIVPEDDAVSFIDDLEVRARAHGSSLTVVSVSSDKESSPPMLMLSLTLKGTFDTVMRTIGDIENAPHAVTISSVSLGHDEKEAWHADVKLAVISKVAVASSSPTTPVRHAP